jgi:hypothetical protein
VKQFRLQTEKGLCEVCGMPTDDGVEIVTTHDGQEWWDVYCRGCITKLNAALRMPQACTDKEE